MNSLKNRVQLIGHLGNTPELKSFENGVKLAKFSIATNERFKNAKGEYETETQWHQVVAWGGAAERVSKALQKGNEVALEGKLITRNYQDKDGQTRYITEVVLGDFVRLTKKEETPA
jgi:single-strand DNA-binding protein